MKVYIASSKSYWDIIAKHRFPYILTSFMELRSDKRYWQSLNNYLTIERANFLLDSGAFTFMNTKKNATRKDLDTFVEQYTKFIRDNDIDLFFEMDVDAITGLEVVEDYRRYIEKYTHKKVIPVWHKSRGLKYWDYMIRHYDYVAIGGIAAGIINLRKMWPIIQKMILQAQERGVKVHGLGVGIRKEIWHLPFDTVDSASYLTAARYTQINIWDPIKKDFTRKQSRLFYKKRVDITLKSWRRFVDYAEKYL